MCETAIPQQRQECTMEHDRAASQETRPESEAYEEPPPEFIDQVMSMVEAIPPGRVMTYGDIAMLLTARAEFAGLPEAYGPRMVGYVMSRFGASLPWWRVIRSTGHPQKFHQEEALTFYRKENTPLIESDDSYRIDLKRARFHPDVPDDQSRLEGF
jgi:alkylated DNA nucleotide flippase Atl1